MTTLGDLHARLAPLMDRCEKLWKILCLPDDERFDLAPQLGTGEQVVFATRWGWTALDVYVNGQGDAGVTNATVKIYAVAGSVRTLLSTTTIVSGSTSQRIAWRCSGCDKYEVTLTPSSKPAVVTLVSAWAFGREASDFTSTTTVTLAGDVVGPSNANTVAQISNGAGTIYAQPNATVLGLEIGSQAAGAAGAYIGPLIGNPTAGVGIWVGGSAFTPTGGNYCLFLPIGVFSGTAFLQAALNVGSVLPNQDNLYNCGTNANRWALVRGVVVTSGDLNLTDEERHADWTLREHGDWVEARNRTTGDRFALMMRPLDPCEERESDYAESKMVQAMRARDERIAHAARVRKDEEEAARLEELADTLPPDQQGAAE